MNEQGPVCVGCYPHCRGYMTTRQGVTITKTRRNEKGGRRGVYARVGPNRDRVRGEGSERVIGLSETDASRREKRATIACLSTRPARGIYTIRVRERDNILYAGKGVGSGKKGTKRIQDECPACDIARRRMRRESGDQIILTSE